MQKKTLFNEKIKAGDFMVLTKIRDLRDEHELNQIKTAALMGVSKSTYARWETDEAIIPLRHLNDLCNYFNVSMDYITGFSKKRNYDKQFSGFWNNICNLAYRNLFNDKIFIPF